MRQADLRKRTRKELANLAKRKGIPGWHAMRKEKLVRALARLDGHKVRTANRTASASEGRKSQRKRKSRTCRARARSTGDSAHRPAASPASLNNEGGLSRANPIEKRGEQSKDRVLLSVRDPYWLHVCWEIGSKTVQRAEAALREQWHKAKPVLRLYDVSSEETTSSIARHIRDVEIRCDVNNWYINVANPPRSFRVDIGYLTDSGRFYALAHSNVVTTPSAGASEVREESWQELQQELEKADELDVCHSPEEFERRLRQRTLRLMGSGAITNSPTGLNRTPQRRGFWFQVDAELIVYGATDPAAKVTLQGVPGQLSADGTFTVRFALPDRRQVIPAVARSRDGREERTIVLAVERNTKELEPIHRDG